jgi:diadenylate cyclase
MQQFWSSFESDLAQLHMPTVRWTDVVEILIIAFLTYHIIMWIRNTRAYSLLKGILVIVVFVMIAAIFNMTTILWIVQNVASIFFMALIVILQPELRNAMEELGQKNVFRTFFHTGSKEDGLYSDRTVNEIVRACVAMAKVKTGALIVIRMKTPLREYERTGIDIDAVVSSQLLINIFEKNTPLHDGAVIIEGNRVTSATCYLPLSDNKSLDKNLGTRHRAGIGISECTDALTIIVSEETGQISTAYRGSLSRNLTGDALRDFLTRFQGKSNTEEKHSIFVPWKGKEDDK